MEEKESEKTEEGGGRFAIITAISQPLICFVVTVNDRSLLRYRYVLRPQMKDMHTQEITEQTCRRLLSGLTRDY